MLDLIDYPEQGDEITFKLPNIAPRDIRASTNTDCRLNQDTMASLTQDTITGAMSSTEILRYLVVHGCRDISKDLDISQVSEHPVSGGGFGDVYRAKLRNGDQVGLKCVRMLVGSTAEGKQFLKYAAHELYVWSKCKHPNILELSGVAIFRNQIAMVSLWMENGHLRWFLSRHPQADRCMLCVNIVDGVDYLHKSGIIHGDLKPENILVANDHTPKLTDFGNALISEYSLKFSHSNTTQNMTPRYSAPEILEGKKATHAGDIYALGVVIFVRFIGRFPPYTPANEFTYQETTTGILPYYGLNYWAIISNIIKGEVPTRPEAHIPTGIQQADRLWMLITSCWANNPLERPKASEVKNKMEGITPEGLHANEN
ncbi:hypothetical protein OPQ81_006227 [Rhizoctonia solani]|nr:hypothetical protein OPQ81_006227 [Rhizoctonia solani]